MSGFTVTVSAVRWREIKSFFVFTQLAGTRAWWETGFPYILLCFSSSPHVSFQWLFFIHINIQKTLIYHLVLLFYF